MRVARVRFWRKVAVLCFSVVGLFGLILLLRMATYTNKLAPVTKPADMFEEIKVGLIEIDSDSILKYGEGIATLPQVRNILHGETCPLCFGKSLCSDFETGAMAITSKSLVSPSRKFGKVTYRGFTGNRDEIFVKTFEPEVFTAFEEKVCLDATHNKTCKVKNAAPSSFLYRFKSQFAKNISSIYKLFGRSRGDIPLILCPTEKFMATLQESFDDNESEMLSDDEGAILISTVALNPEAAVLRFLSSSTLSSLFVHYLGACGRAVVVEGDLTPLSNSLNESFQERAKIAVQLISLVEELQSDTEWLFLISNFDYENLAVDSEGDVILLDVGGMAVIDKTLYEVEETETEENKRKICNRECFSKLTHDVYNAPDLGPACKQMGENSHLMYALVCQQVLSDEDDHKVSNFFNPQARGSPRSLAGLLHSAPSSLSQTIKELMAECIEEKEPGGRIRAAGELQDLLEELSSTDSRKEGDE